MSQYEGFWYGAEIRHYGSTRFIGPFTFTMMGRPILTLEDARVESLTYAATYNSRRNELDWATPLYGEGFVGTLPPKDQVPLFDMEWEGGGYPVTGGWTYPGLDV